MHKQEEDNSVYVPSKNIIFTHVPCPLCRKSHTFILERAILKCHSTEKRLLMNGEKNAEKATFVMDVSFLDDYLRHSANSVYQHIIKKLTFNDLVKVNVVDDKSGILKILIDDFRKAFMMDFEVKTDVHVYDKKQGKDLIVNELVIKKPFGKVWQ